MASLQRVLRGVRTISLDTAVFLARSDHADRRQACAEWLLGEVEAGRFHCVISALSAAELLVRPSAMGPSRAIASQAALRRFPHLAIRPFTVDDAVDAAQVRAHTRLRLPDAIVISTALVAEVDALVHCDDAWDLKTASYAGRISVVNLNRHCR